MKYLVYPIIAIFLSLSFSSCTTEDDDDLGLDTSPNTFVANLEGEAWNAVKKEAVLTNDYLIVYGQAANATIVTLKMKLYKYQPVGKAYVLSNGSEHFAAYDFTGPLDSLIYWSKNNSDKYGQSGDIELTKLDKVNKLVSGTFKFRAFNNHNKLDYLYLSQGAFTDIAIVDNLTIDVTGQNIINNDDDDDDDDDNGGGSSADFVNCTINGTGSNSTSTGLSNTSGTLSLQGLYSNLSQVVLMFPSTIDLGTYDLANATNSVHVSYVSGGVAYSASPTGSFTLTEKTSSRISGSFNAVLTNTADDTDVVTITTGTFSQSLLQ